MSEIKPVYRGKLFEDTAWVYMDSKPKERESYLIIETLYPAAAYEALQKENQDLRYLNLSSMTDLQFKNRDLGAENAAQAKRIAELEDQLSSFPIPTAVAMQKISKLRQEGFKEYAATVLNKENQYCIVGDYGDVRWASKNGK